MLISLFTGLVAAALSISATPIFNVAGAKVSQNYLWCLLSTLAVQSNSKKRGVHVCLLEHLKVGRGWVIFFRVECSYLRAYSISFLKHQKSFDSKSWASWAVYEACFPLWFILWFKNKLQNIIGWSYVWNMLRFQNNCPLLSSLPFLRASWKENSMFLRCF